MPNGTSGGVPTKADLQDMVDEALEVLETAYVPEADRGTLVDAVAQAIGALQGNTGDEDDTDDDTDEDDDTD
jgi:hypothetical protein